MGLSGSMTLVRDSKMPGIDNYYETYPFLLNIHPSGNIMEFDNSGISSDVFYIDDLRIAPEFYDRSYSDIYGHDKLGINFVDCKPDTSLYYGISFLNNMNRNRVYLSLFSEDRVTVRSFALIDMVRDNPYNYKTFTNIKRDFITLSAGISRDKKTIEAGIKNDFITATAGISDNESVPATIILNYKRITAISEFSYYYNERDIESDIKVFFPFSYRRFHITAIGGYDGQFSFHTGILYRILPRWSVMMNYQRSGGNFIEGGFKYTRENVFANAGFRFNADSTVYEAVLSAGILNNYMSSGINIVYSNEENINILLSMQKTFFDGNLVPRIILGMKSRDIYTTMIGTELIDAYIFAGSDWNIADSTYLIKGGLQWYFEE